MCFDFNHCEVSLNEVMSMKAFILTHKCSSGNLNFYHLKTTSVTWQNAWLGWLKVAELFYCKSSCLHIVAQ